MRDASKRLLSPFGLERRAFFAFFLDCLPIPGLVKELSCKFFLPGLVYTESRAAHVGGIEGAVKNACSILAVPICIVDKFTRVCQHFLRQLVVHTRSASLRSDQAHIFGRYNAEFNGV